MNERSETGTTELLPVPETLATAAEQSFKRNLHTTNLLSWRKTGVADVQVASGQSVVQR